MKILLGNNTLALLAGTERWTQTLAIQLKKMGHEVTCFSPELGIISDQLEKDGITSFNQISTSGVKPFSFILEENIDHNYDVIIANHHHVVEFLRKEFPKTPIISTIHGIMHLVDDRNGSKIKAPEYPALNSGVNQFISVSEEVRDMLLKEYNIDSLIVRNFFDTRSFIPLYEGRVFSEKPERFLINSNYNDKDSEDVKIIREVAKHYGAKVVAVGQNFSFSDDIMKAINDSDIVVGMGRSVLEGVAARRLGIVHGRWGTGGVVNESNVEELRKFNFSGRNSNGKFMTVDQLISEIDKYYTRENLMWGVEYTRREHNVVTAAETYVRIAEDLMGKSIKRPEQVTLHPYRRQKDV